VVQPPEFTSRLRTRRWSIRLRRWKLPCTLESIVDNVSCTWYDINGEGIFYNLRPLPHARRCLVSRIEHATIIVMVIVCDGTRREYMPRHAQRRSSECIMRRFLARMHYVRPSCKIHVHTAPARVMVVHICKHRGQCIMYVVRHGWGGRYTVDRHFIIASSSSRVRVAWEVVEHATSIVILVIVCTGYYRLSDSKYSTVVFNSTTTKYGFMSMMGARA
jgi:hypothetical protein